MGNKKFIQNLMLFLHKPLLKLIESKKICTNLPKRYVVACNHPSYADGMFIYLFWYWHYKKKLSVFAHEKYFGNLFTRFYLITMNCIKVSYDKPGDSLKYAYSQPDKYFCLFIEGKRTKGKLIPKTGCVRLSKFHNVPVVPIKIINRGMFRKKIIIGDLFYPTSKNVKKESSNLLNIIYGLNWFKF